MYVCNVCMYVMYVMYVCMYVCVCACMRLCVYASTCLCERPRRLRSPGGAGSKSGARSRSFLEQRSGRRSVFGVEIEELSGGEVGEAVRQRS